MHKDTITITVALLSVLIGVFALGLIIGVDLYKTKNPVHTTTVSKQLHHIRVVDVKTLDALSIVLHCPKNNIYSIQIGETLHQYKWDDNLQDCKLLKQ